MGIIKNSTFLQYKHLRTLILRTNYIMKVFAALCLLFVIQTASTFTLPSEDDVLDTLEDCGVSWDDGSLDCALDFVHGQVGMRMLDAMFDVDWDMVLDGLGQCGFAWEDDTLECLQAFVPDM